MYFDKYAAEGCQDGCREEPAPWHMDMLTDCVLKISSFVTVIIAHTTVLKTVGFKPKVKSKKKKKSKYDGGSERL